MSTEQDSIFENGLFPSQGNHNRSVDFNPHELSAIDNDKAPGAASFPAWNEFHATSVAWVFTHARLPPDGSKRPVDG